MNKYVYNFPSNPHTVCVPVHLPIGHLHPEGQLICIPIGPRRHFIPLWALDVRPERHPIAAGGLKSPSNHCACVFSIQSMYICAFFTQSTFMCVFSNPAVSRWVKISIQSLHMCFISYPITVHVSILHPITVHMCIVQSNSRQMCWKSLPISVNVCFPIQ